MMTAGGHPQKKNFFPCSFSAFFASNRETILTMKEKEKAFSNIVKRCKNTIFTVCYLFSKDQEEANDLFQTHSEAGAGGFGGRQSEHRINQHDFCSN